MTSLILNLYNMHIFALACSKACTACARPVHLFDLSVLIFCWDFCVIISFLNTAGFYDNYAGWRHCISFRVDLESLWMGGGGGGGGK